MRGFLQDTDFYKNLNKTNFTRYSLRRYSLLTKLLPQTCKRLWERLRGQRVQQGMFLTNLKKLKLPWFQEKRVAGWRPPTVGIVASIWLNILNSFENIHQDNNFTSNHLKITKPFSLRRVGSQSDLYHAKESDRQQAWKKPRLCLL